METPLNTSQGSGNWIATFAFGLFFDLLYSLHLHLFFDHLLQGIGSGIISGILCLAMGWVADYVRLLLKKYVIRKTKLKK